MRFKVKILILGAIIGLLSFVPQTGYSYEDGDWQYWNTESIEGTIMKVNSKNLDSVSAKLEGEWRFGDDMSEFYYQHIDMGVKFKKLFTEWFSFGIYYRQVWEYAHSDSGNYWFDEYRPHFDPEVNFKIKGWSIKDRLMLELRYFDNDISGKVDVWRVRNKISVKPPVKWTEWELTPYIADEIFIEEHKSGVYRNRLFGGITLGRLFKIDVLKGDIYYLWESTESSSNWKSVNAVGTKIKVQF